MLLDCARAIRKFRLIRWFGCHYKNDASVQTTGSRSFCLFVKSKIICFRLPTFASSFLCKSCDWLFCLTCHILFVWNPLTAEITLHFSLTYLFFYPPFILPFHLSFYMLVWHNTFLVCVVALNLHSFLNATIHLFFFLQTLIQLQLLKIAALEAISVVIVFYDESHLKKMLIQRIKTLLNEQCELTVSHHFNCLIFEFN